MAVHKRKENNMKTALTIAGSDSSGGAGIQADIKTMTANGVYAMSAVTALTAQNTTGVTDILEATPAFLAAELDAVFTDIYPDAVKIGMVSSSALIEVIADKLRQYGAERIVVDPVMVATSGARLISETAVETLKERLLPLATVLTPNIPEAELLSGMTITGPEGMEAAARAISERYGCAVLCKGGHQINDADDLLWRNGTGKSTLLRILAHQDSSFSGTLRDGAGLKIGYYAQESEKTLNNANTVLGELEEVADTRDLPRLRNMLGSFLFHDDDVFKSVGVLSGGEKSRLALLKILLHPANLLILDEPTNHLDINTKEMLLEAIKTYDGTVVFVSHDTHFIKNLATRILYLSDEEPVFFEGDYDYFSYKLEEKESRFLEKEKAAKAVKSAQMKPDSASSDHRSQKERRNQIQKLEKQLDALMKKIDDLTLSIKSLEEKMGQPEVYSVPAKISEVVKEKETMEAEVEKLNEEWFTLSQELEELQK